MGSSSSRKAPFPLYVKLLAVAMSLVVSGLGVIALVAGEAPARWTRHGLAGPLIGSQAQVYGLSLLFFGLLPLMMLMKSSKAAAWFGTAVALLGLCSVFFGAYLLG